MAILKVEGYEVEEVTVYPQLYDCEHPFLPGSPWIAGPLTQTIQDGLDPSNVAEGEMLAEIQKTIAFIGPNTTDDEQMAINHLNSEFEWFQVGRERKWMTLMFAVPTEKPMPIFKLKYQKPFLGGSTLEALVWQEVADHTRHFNRPNYAWVNHRYHAEYDYIRTTLSDDPAVCHYLDQVRRFYLNWRRVHDQNPNDPDFLLAGQKLKYIIETIANYPMETE